MGTDRKHFWRIAATVAACLVVYLIGNDTVGLWDRDEPRNAQASRQMLQSGDYIVPRYLDIVRTAKPVFHYWCQATVMRFLGDNAFSARLPSVVAMVVLLILLSRVLWKYVDPEHAFWTVFILGTSALVMGSAKVCLTDALLLLWITIAQLCLFATWIDRAPWWTPAVMWTSVGLAVLTKGPVVLGVQVMTVIFLQVFDRYGVAAAQRRGIKWLLRTRPIIGVIIVLAVAGPWYYLVKQQAPEVIKQGISNEILARIFKPLEGHAGPPGYHLLTIWGTFLPWSLFLPGLIWNAWNRRGDDKIRFALAASIGPWLMMEMVQTKLPHYILPIFPMLSYLATDMLLRAVRREHGALSDRWAIIGIGFWSLIVASFGLLPWLSLDQFPDTSKTLLTIMTMGMIVYALSVFTRFRFGDVTGGAAAMGVGMLVIIFVGYGLILPRLQFLRLSQNVAADLIPMQLSPSSNPCIMIDYMEPSLAFHEGGHVREGGTIGFGMRFIVQLTPTIVMTRDVWNKSSPDIRDRYQVVSSHRGLNYADRGRVVEVLIVKRR